MPYKREKVIKQASCKVGKWRAKEIDRGIEEGLKGLSKRLCHTNK